MSLGQDLKNERETRGISLEEMALSTKIGTRYLEALENDNLEILPGAFLTKSIIRSYVKFIGLDENEVLGKYRESGLLAPDDNAASARSEGRTVIPGKNKFIIGIVIVVGLVLIIIALLFLWKPQKSKVPINPKQESTVPQLDQYLPLAPGTSDPVPAQTIQEEQKKLTLVITFQDETWIEIFSDGVRIVYDLKLAGEKVEIEAEHEILMNIGNAAGVTYLLNGKPGKTLGRADQVIMDIRITHDNLQDFIEIQDPAER